MKLKQQAFVLLTFLISVHLAVLTYASWRCINVLTDKGGRDPNGPGCEELGQTWQRTTESYVAVILALLVPTTQIGE